ncbi:MULTISPECIES: ribbon-helix-helix protein, CopG family [unclassified Micromonospora]|uniref:ribbon-helix-helix protein, CopG family n=1 Tax=unclassified Micromonospora TaxID=2617518 RepID=UPI003A889DF8
MALKKTTVMVDEDDLRIIKEAAAREGRPESEYFREAFHIAALRARRWSRDWDIPEFGFGGPVSDDDVRAAVAEAEDRKYGSSGHAA